MTQTIMEPETGSAFKLLGQNIRHYRKQLGISKFKLCADAELEMKRLIAIEKGEHNPTLLTISKIADALGVSISALFAETPVQDTFQLSSMQSSFDRMSRPDQDKALAILRLQIELSKQP